MEVPTESLEPLCLWESVNPTTAADVIATGMVKGHYLILFFIARVDAVTPSVKLQEVRGSGFGRVRACWVGLDQVGLGCVR